MAPAWGDETSFSITPLPAGGGAPGTPVAYNQYTANFSLHYYTAPPNSVVIEVKPFGFSRYWHVTVSRRAPLYAGVWGAAHPRPAWEAPTTLTCRISEAGWPGSFSEYPPAVPEFEIKRVGFDSGRKLLFFWATFRKESTATQAGFEGEIKLHADAAGQPFDFPPGISIDPIPTRRTLAAELPIVARLGDDGPGPLPMEWRLVSGPAPVAFADPAAPETVARFTATGTYRLRATVSDGQASTSAEWEFTLYDPEENSGTRGASGTVADRKVQVFAPGGYGPVEYETLVSVLPDGGLFVKSSRPYDDGCEFHPPPGTSFTAGATYELSASPSSARIGPPYSSGVRTGHLIVHELTYADSQTVSSLWISYVLEPLSGYAGIGDTRFRASAASNTARPFDIIALAGFTEPERWQTVPLAILSRFGNAPEAGTILRWEQLSGPADASIAFAANPVYASATFPVPGAYVLRATMETGGRTASSTITINQTNLVTSFSGRLQKPKAPDTAFHLDGRDGEFNAFRYADTLQVGFKNKNQSQSAASLLITSTRLEDDTVRPLRPGVHGSTVDYGASAYCEIRETPIGLPPGVQIISGAIANHLEIRRVTRDAEGNIDSLWAIFSLEAGAGLKRTSFQGELRWRVPMDDFPANVAPRVRTSDRAVAFASAGVAVTMEGHVEDDLLPVGQPLQYQWELVSGPGPVVFDTPQCLNSVAHFTAAGTYRLRLTSGDGKFSAADECSVVIGGPLPGAGAFRGLVKYEGVNAGQIRVQLSASGAASGMISVGGDSLPFSGVFKDGVLTRKWKIGYWPSDWLVLTIRRTEGSAILTGTLAEETDSDFDKILKFEAAPAAAAFLTGAGLTLPAPAADYTFALTSAPTVHSPEGHGFGRLTVSASGGVKMTGVLADGRAFSVGGILQGLNDFTFYLPLYKRDYGLAGAISMHGPDFHSSLEWSRPPMGGKFYPQGFGVPIDFIASPFRAPPAEENLLTLETAPASGKVEVNLPEWDRLESRRLTIAAGNVLALNPATAGLTLRFTPRTGLFTGQILDPKTKRPRALRGAVLQRQQVARGFLLSPTASGPVEVTGDGAWRW